MVSNILPWCRTCPDDCSLLGSSEVRCSGSPRQADPGATSGTILDGEIHIFIGELTIPAIENHDTPWYTMMINEFLQILQILQH